MTTTTMVELSDAELALVRAALQTYLYAFGHDQADQVHSTKALIAKLDAVTGHRPVVTG